MEQAMTLAPRGRRPRLVLRMIEEQGPTPETKAKLRPDRLLELFTAGLIDQQQFTAGGEIRAVFDAVSAMHFRPMNLGGPDKTGTSSARHPMDGMPYALARLHRTKYLPWIRAMENKRFRGLRVSEILIGIIVDSNVLSDYAADETSESLLAVARVLRDALDAY